MLYTNKRNWAKTTFHHVNADIGGISIGWREVSHDTVVYSMAFCSTKDTFNKKTARDLINTRLDSVSVSDDGGIQYPEVLDRMIEVYTLQDIHLYLSEFGNFPNVTNTKRLKIINDMKLRDCSYTTLRDIFYNKKLS